MSHTATLAFGPLLKHLRKQAGMTQRDLAAALGYSESLICSLEKAQRLPDLQAVTARFIPALGLQDDPNMAATLIEQAALARGERPPTAVTFQRTTQLSIQDSLAEPVHALPFPPTELIGRDAAINQLCNRLLGHQGRLLTMVGPPGIGKTRLALAVGAQLQPHYRDGVLFVPLAAISDAATMAAAILAASNSNAVSAKPSQIRLVEYLRRKSLLLVLDNFEQLLAPTLADEAVHLVATLVAECLGVIVLTTSRERLHLRSEQCYKVPPLALTAALELFVQRAQAVNSEFSLSTHNRADVAAICERLDRLPLAIELCAAQIDLFAPTQLLAQLQTRPLDLLVNGARDLPPQQRTLRDAITRSYALLSEEERILFRALGIFVGGFALPEVAAVMVDELERAEEQLREDVTAQSLLSNLRALVNKSLVHGEITNTGKPRFLLLETIREFALEQLQLHGEATALRQRHYLAYLQLFRIGDRYLRGAEAAIWVARLVPEQDNLRSALKWLFGEKRYADAAWAMMPLSYFWFLIGQRYETAGWLKQLLPQRQSFPVDLRLGLLLVVANAVPPEARIVYTDEILQLLESSSNQLLQAAAWGSLAATLPGAAKAAALERAIALNRTSDGSAEDFAFGAATDRNFLLFTHLMTYADFHLNQGGVAQATTLATESLTINRLRGDQSAIGNGLALLGRVAFLQGDLAQAHTYFQEVMTIAATHNYATMRCEWQPLLALIILYQGNATEAQRLLYESINFCLEQQEKFFLARNYTYLTESALATGALAEAEQWLAQSMAYHADPRQITLDEVERLLIAARLATAQQQYLRAATLFGLADQVHNQIEYVIAGPIRTLAEVALVKVREALDQVVFAEAFAAGQHLSLEAAFATILAPAYSAGTPLRI